jgi:hypothetical protein
MPKFRILPADDDSSRPEGGMFRRARACGSASRDGEQGFGSLARSTFRPKSSDLPERRSPIEADATNGVGEVCWVSLIGKATDRFGELEGSNPFTQLQSVSPLGTLNPCDRSAEAGSFVLGCTYEAALTQIVKVEFCDPLLEEGLRMQ